MTGLNLADVLAGGDSQPVLTATVIKLWPDGSVDLALLGGTASNVPVLASYTPQNGDPVLVLRVSDANLVVLGGIRTANTTTAPFNTRTSLKWNVYAAPVSGPVVPNPLTIDAVSSGSYRSADKWGGRNYPVQGAYVSTYGYYQGAFFYGSGAFSDLRGKTVTKITWTVGRKNDGGVISNVPVYAALHSHTSRPSGAPNYTTGAKNIGVLDRNQTDTFTLPDDWGQKLVDGKARGIGMLRLSTSNYSIYKGTSDGASQGRIQIYWK